MRFSRQHIPTPKGMFLQVDERMKVSGEGIVIEINGKAIDPAKDYDIATSMLLLQGMDNVKPLVEFAQQCPERIPSEDVSRPAKSIVFLQRDRSIHDPDLDIIMDGDCSNGACAGSASNGQAVQTSAVHSGAGKEEEPRGCAPLFFDACGTLRLF